MDFLDPDKKKKHNRRLFIGYVLIGVGVLLAALILFMQSYGYDLDRRTGKVIQNGLIFASARPESATIVLNGKEQGRTDTRLTVPADTYTIELKRDGYRTWKRSFTLEGSSIERLQYPVLYPTTLNQKDVVGYDTTPAFATQSPDRRWILTQKPGGFTSFDVFDTNNVKQAPVTITTPTDLLSADKGEHKLELVEWSTDNRHVILKHTFGSSFELILLDRENSANSLNLTKLLNLPVTTSVALRDKKFDQLYLFDPVAQTLKSADVKSKAITPVLTSVVAYKSYGAQTLLYAVTDPTNASKTNVKIRDDGKDFTLRSFTDSKEFLLDITRFDDHWYAVIGPKSDGRVSIYKDPLTVPKQTGTNLPTAHTALLMKDPQQIMFSANARFIMSQSGNKFAIYDAETNRRYYYDLPYDLGVDQKATWIDGHRLSVTHENKVQVFDFDGINQQALVPISGGTLPFFDRDYTRLYTVAPSVQDAAKSALTQTPLRVNLQ